MRDRVCGLTLAIALAWPLPARAADERMYLNMSQSHERGREIYASQGTRRLTSDEMLALLDRAPGAAGFTRGLHGQIALHYLIGGASLAAAGAAVALVPVTWQSGLTGQGLVEALAIAGLGYVSWNAGKVFFTWEGLQYSWEDANDAILAYNGWLFQQGKLTVPARADQEVISGPDQHLAVVREPGYLAKGRVPIPSDRFVQLLDRTPPWVAPAFHAQLAADRRWNWLLGGVSAVALAGGLGMLELSYGKDRFTTINPPLEKAGAITGGLGLLGLALFSADWERHSFGWDEADAAAAAYNRWLDGGKKMAP